MPKAYDPLLSPLEIPLHLARVKCVSRQPLHLPITQGSTPGTLLNGLFQTILLATRCHYSHLEDFMDDEALANFLRHAGQPNGPPVCGCGTRDFSCREPDRCPCAVLVRVPYSWQLGRTFPPVVKLSAPELWQGKPLSAFQLNIAVIGRRSLAHAGLIWETVQRMGVVGLRVRGEQVQLAIERPRTAFEGTLASVLENALPPTSCRLEFATPMLMAERVHDEQGELHRAFQAGGMLDLPKLLGDLAFDLCALDLDDRPRGPWVDDRKYHAEKSRKLVREAAKAIVVRESNLTPTDMGSRMSKTQQGRYALRGFTGHAVLEEIPETLYPYLFALAHWRAGQLGSKGFGELRLWRTD